MINNSYIKPVLTIITGFIFIIMTWTAVSTSGENKRLRSEIKDKISEINRLESEKKAIFESIEKDSLTILAKNAIILDLSKNEDLLINNLKILNHEKNKIRSIYLNSDVNKRVLRFTKLATEAD